MPEPVPSCIQGWSQAQFIRRHIWNNPTSSETPGSGRELLTAALTSPPPGAQKTKLCRRSELLRNARATGSAQRKHLLCSSSIQARHLGAWFAGSWCSPFTSRDLRSVIFSCKWKVSYVGLVFLVSENHHNFWHNWLLLFLWAKDLVWQKILYMMSEGHWQRYVTSPGLEKQGRVHCCSNRYWQSLVRSVYLQSIGRLYCGVFTHF